MRVAPSRGQRLSGLLRTKAINADHHLVDTGLRRVLGPVDLTLLGIGAIIGAGIFVLTGVAAATKAGPAIVLAYVVAGTACAFSALAYAELAAAIGGCGSAYGYAYAGLGELVAWVIGWDLILEYSVAVSAVAIGWSGYANNVLQAIGLGLPTALLRAPSDGGIINLPAAAIVLTLAVLLGIGVRESVRVNAAMVLVKLLAIAVFLGVAVFHIDPANWSPFMPFGWEGVMGGAALIFFAYLGFDAVSTAAEEARNPQRDLPIGIIASLAVCTLIYIAVSAVLTGAVPYGTLNVASPVADALVRLGYSAAAGLVAAGAIAGLTTVMLVMFYGLTRIFLAMSRDGLLPKWAGKVHPRFRTPYISSITVGIFVAIFAAVVPIGILGELVSIGTLLAFVIVCAGVWILRVRRPELHRPFKTPMVPLVPILGIAVSMLMMLSLPWDTWLRLIGWLVVGMAVYFGYGRKHSVVQNLPKK